MHFFMYICVCVSDGDTWHVWPASWWWAGRSVGTSRSRPPVTDALPRWTSSVRNIRFYVIHHDSLMLRLGLLHQELRTIHSCNTYRGCHRRREAVWEEVSTWGGRRGPRATITTMATAEVSASFDLFKVCQALMLGGLLYESLFH